MEHDMRVSLQYAKPLGDQGLGGGGEPRIVEVPGGAAGPERDVARLEDVLTTKQVDPELAACLQADAAGLPEGATNLGVLLEQRGDREGALAAYRRADRRGDINGTFNLGSLLAEMGDLEGARAALERADERGDAGAASNLGVLLEQQGDIDGAFAAYGRADERGDGAGALNLGLLLARRGDVAGARAAYQRAAERGDEDVAQRAAHAMAQIPLPEPEPAPAPAPDAEPVAGPEPYRAPSRRRWIVALCLLGLLAFVVMRARRRPL